MARRHINAEYRLMDVGRIKNAICVETEVKYIDDADGEWMEEESSKPITKNVLLLESNAKDYKLFLNRLMSVGGYETVRNLATTVSTNNQGLEHSMYILAFLNASERDSEYRDDDLMFIPKMNTYLEELKKLVIKFYCAGIITRPALDALKW